MIKNHFNKNLVKTAEDEKRFQSSNKCWVCNKLLTAKVRNHDHVTGKYRGSSPWNCNVNLKLTKKLPVLFQNLKGYDSHLIIQEIVKFFLKINVIPNINN